MTEGRVGFEGGELRVRGRGRRARRSRSSIRGSGTCARGTAVRAVRRRRVSAWCGTTSAATDGRADSPARRTRTCATCWRCSTPRAPRRRRSSGARWAARSRSTRRSRLPTGSGRSCPWRPALGGVEDLEEEIEWWERVSAPDRGGARGRRPRARRGPAARAIWAPLGTDDPAGARIREIAFDNIHEITRTRAAPRSSIRPLLSGLGEIDVPTLVIAAEHDPPGGRRISDLIARGVLDARLVTIEGADHVVNLRQPDAFDAAVLPFLAEVR